VLCCSTGLRISDALKIRAEDVDLSPSNPHIDVVTKKTSKAISIELNRYSRAILESYIPLNRSGSLFRRMNLRELNSYIRKVAMLAGLDRPICVLSYVGSRATQEIHPIHEVISSHWGRHTFVVHALSLGISPQTIMSWTGHSSYDAIKPYIAIVSSLKKSSMKKFDE
jgi:integrase